MLGQSVKGIGDAWMVLRHLQQAHPEMCIDLDTVNSIFSGTPILPSEPNNQPIYNRRGPPHHPALRDPQCARPNSIPYPHILMQVTSLLKRSQWGAITVTQLQMREDDDVLGQDFYSLIMQGWRACMQLIRERLYSALLLMCGRQKCSLEDLNAVIVRVDFGKLREISQAVAVLLGAFLDLRRKNLFNGAILCAGIRHGNKAQPRQVLHVWTSGG